MNDKENLFNEFPEISKEAWVEKVEKDLKGRALEELDWIIDEDIKVAPFYHAISDTINVPNNNQSSNRWEIGEDIFLEDSKSANQQLLKALENGVNAPRIIIDRDCNETEFGVLFQNVNLSYISIHFLIKKGRSAFSTLENFHSFLSNKNIDTDLKGSINHDDDQLVKLIQFSIDKLQNFKIRTLKIDTTDTTISASLAQVLSKGVDYLALSNEQGITAETANNHLQFSISVGKSYFLEMAKIRALKILWANILEAYGVKNTNIPDIEAHLSQAAFGDDPNTNMIRSTTQAMSAILGGVNRLTVLPSDSNRDKTSEFSKRISRNVQHLLTMESFMDRVIDPAKGSYYIETLTKKIAETAWLEFQKTESKKIAKK